MSNQFTLEGRAKGLPDISRSWLWELSIPQIGSIVPSITEEGLTVRFRTASIPGKTIENIESFFMGSKQFFPGKSLPTGTFTTTIEETEDQYIFKSIHEWTNKIFDWNPEAANPGSSSFEKKRAGMVTDGFLKMYKYGKNTLQDKMIRYHNMWPSSIGDVTLDYNSNNAISYEVVWTYDYYTEINAQ